jgi:hypothetical protein
MSTHTLIYTSVANQKMADNELKELLKKSRANNSSLEITGMLLYLDPFFIQVLEGDEVVINKAFDTIKQDPRHYKVSIIYKKLIPHRLFPDWTMGFNKITKESIEKIEGYSDYLQKPSIEFFNRSPNKVFELLNLFKREILF